MGELKDNYYRGDGVSWILGMGRKGSRREERLLRDWDRAWGQRMGPRRIGITRKIEREKESRNRRE